MPERTTDSPEIGTLIIRGARFGTSNGADSKDVTLTVRAKIIDNKLSFTVGRFGMPARQPKDSLRRLFVDYEFVGRAPAVLSAVEGKKVALP